MRENTRELALLEAMNLGRPLRETLGEVMYAAGLWEYFADAAQDVIGETRAGGDGMMAMEIRYESNAETYCVPCPPLWWA